MNYFKSVVKKLSSVFFCKLSRSHPAAYREMPLKQSFVISGRYLFKQCGPYILKWQSEVDGGWPRFENNNFVK